MTLGAKRSSVTVTGLVVAFAINNLAALVLAWQAIAIGRKVYHAGCHVHTAYKFVQSRRKPKCSAPGEGWVSLE
jgi:hypothetical protein